MRGIRKKMTSVKATVRIAVPFVSQKKRCVMRIGAVAWETAVFTGKPRAAVYPVSWVM
jgi:hypothetical protein